MAVLHVLPSQCRERVPWPAAGYRNNDSASIDNVTSNGNYWLSVPNSSTKGHNLNFNSGNVNPQNNNNRSNGYCVWAALSQN